VATPDLVLTLETPSVVLEPLSQEHVDQLLAAASLDRSSYAYTWVPSTVREMQDYVAVAEAERLAGRHLPFVLRRRSDAVVLGTTRFSHLETFDWPSGHLREGRNLPDVVEIGHTWLRADVQGTAVNTEVKVAMVDHAFGVWEVLRVRLCTDARNLRSRRAIERLGARLDGVLRADRLAADSTIRSTASYTLLADEWPQARAALLQRRG